MRTQNIYIYLRSPIKRLSVVVHQLQQLMHSHPGADVTLAGLGLEDDDALVSLGLVVPVSNSDPSAISALKFAHALNLSFFDYMPFYNKAPSPQEQEALQKFLELEYTPGDTNVHILDNERETLNA